MVRWWYQHSFRMVFDGLCSYVWVHNMDGSIVMCPLWLLVSLSKHIMPLVGCTIHSGGNWVVVSVMASHCLWSYAAMRVAAKVENGTWKNMKLLWRSMTYFVADFNHLFQPAGWGFCWGSPELLFGKAVKPVLCSLGARQGGSINLEWSTGWFHERSYKSVSDCACAITA